jgi:transcriptional regulator with XRE-family HTH domain
MTVTIADVAAKAGVSTATVSRVLSGLGRASTATQARVLEAARDLGYRPSEVARSLQRRSTQTLGLIITDIAYGAEHATRAVGRFAPAEGGADPGLPVRAARHVRPGADPDHARLHSRPDVDVGMAGDEHVGVRDRGRRPGLLRAVDEVVHEHAQPPSRAGGEPGHGRTEVVHAVHRLDDDALDTQVVPPDPLDELGVVHALHPDPRGPRGARAQALDAHGAGRRQGRSRGLPGRRHQRRRHPLDEERRRPQGEQAAPAVSVLQDQLTGVDVGDRPAEPAGSVLDDHAGLRDDLGDGAAATHERTVRRERVPVVV